MTRVEQALFFIGFGMLALWGTQTLESIVLSRAAIAKFETLNSRGPVQRILLEEVEAPLAVLRIPRIHLEVPLFDGTDRATLNHGAGRIDGTAEVGAGGNLGIAAHRDRFFRGLKDVMPGDVIDLERHGGTDFYVIDWIRIVEPTDVSVLDQTPAPSLTLVTCFPFYFVGSAPQRYIVRASLRSSTS